MSLPIHAVRSRDGLPRRRWAERLTVGFRDFRRLFLQIVGRLEPDIENRDTHR